MEGLEAHSRSWADNQGIEEMVTASHGAFLIITSATCIMYLVTSMPSLENQPFPGRKHERVCNRSAPLPTLAVAPHDLKNISWRDRVSKKRENICFRGTNVKGGIRSSSSATGRLCERCSSSRSGRISTEDKYTRSFSARTCSRSVHPSLARPTIPGVGYVKLRLLMASYLKEPRTWVHTECPLHDPRWPLLPVAMTLTDIIRNARTWSTVWQPARSDVKPTSA